MLKDQKGISLPRFSLNYKVSCIGDDENFVPYTSYRNSIDNDFNFIRNKGFVYIEPVISSDIKHLLGALNGTIDGLISHRSKDNVDFAWWVLYEKDLGSFDEFIKIIHQFDPRKKKHFLGIAIYSEESEFINPILQNISNNKILLIDGDLDNDRIINRQISLFPDLYEIGGMDERAAYLMCKKSINHIGHENLRQSMTRIFKDSEIWIN